ncbi:hypothetical protein JKY72_05685 [Candidatus Gracilibacteria bacterium]|nr:hypothetical protein [Candidatus Gracilibacteria bacterium]
MGNFRNLALLLLSIFAFSACGGGGADLERVVPESADLVFYFNGEELSEVGEFFEDLPVEGDLNDWIGSLVKMGLGHAFTEEIFSKEFSFVVGMVGEEFFVGGKFEKANKMERFLEDRFEWSFRGDVGVKYYDGEDVFAGRYEDVFFMYSTEVLRKGAVDAFENGGGYGELEDGNLFYWSERDVSEGRVFVDSAGLRFESETRGEFEDYDLALIDFVPKHGVIFYNEILGGLDRTAKIFFGGDEGLSTLISDVVTNKTLGEGKFLEFIKPFAARGDVSIEEVAKFLEEAAFAFGIFDVDKVYPGVSLYADARDDSALAKKVMNGVDAYFDQVIVGLDEQAGSVGASKGVIQREAVNFKGAPFHKLIFDVSAVPQLWGEIPALNIFLKDLNLEIYYGVTADDVFAIVLYPDFDQVYGGESLRENEQLISDSILLGDVYGEEVTYFDGAPLMNLLDKYLQIAKLLGFVEEVDLKDYKKFSEFFAGVRYVGSSALEDGIKKREGYLILED